MSALAWVSWVAVGVVFGLGAGAAWWAARSALRQRRRTRALIRVAMRYRRQRAGRSATAAVAPVTVAELVTKVSAEGSAVRLAWEDGWEADDEWPTAVLPRTAP